MLKVLNTFFCFLIISSLANGQQIIVDFYGESILIKYEKELFDNYSGSLLKEPGIEKAYKSLSQRSATTFIKSVQAAKNKYQLNDWLYAKLIHKSLEKINTNRSNRFIDMMTWVILVKEGYDARATFTKSTIYVNVATKEEVFESPMYDDKGKSFANLTYLLANGRMVNMVYGVKFVPNKYGKDFSFKLNNFPKFSEKKENITYKFDFKGKQELLSASIDKTFITLMKDYPKFDEIDYVKTPLSSAIKTSLIPSLKKRISNFSDIEKMEYLVTFTRRALTYGSDKRNFGKNNRPLTAEEALYYPSVDCEDKVAVIYNLVKELTPLKAVVIAMPNHLSFGVDLKAAKGKSYRHRGKNYIICDPTGPENTCQIGIFPKEYQLRSARVLGELK